MTGKTILVVVVAGAILYFALRSGATPPLASKAKTKPPASTGAAPSVNPFYASLEQSGGTIANSAITAFSQQLQRGLLNIGSNAPANHVDGPSVTTDPSGAFSSQPSSTSGTPALAGTTNFS